MRPWLLEGRVLGVGEESGYLSVIQLCLGRMRPGLTYGVNRLKMKDLRKKKQWC